MPKEPTLAQEIVASLQEWYRIGKELYVHTNTPPTTTPPHTSQGGGGGGVDTATKFHTLRSLILELHECRKRALSSNLTVEGLKELKKRVATTIDAGNR